MKKTFFLIPVMILLFSLNSCINHTNQKDENKSNSIPEKTSLNFSLIIPTISVISNSNHSIEINKNDLTKSIDLGADYLMNQLNKNGYFTYRVNPNVNLRPNYNMLRHAGAIYSLLMYHEFKADIRSCQAAESATEFLKQASLGPVDKMENILGVWSFPNIVASVDKPQLKLGGSGLGLVALSSLERCGEQNTPLAVLQHLANFICYLQKDDGSFYSKYFPAPVGKDGSWVSLYYPGEAVLGLCLLYEIDRNEKWLTASLNAINNLHNQRKGKRVVEADHWALIATGRLLNIVQNIDSSYKYVESILIDHAVQICESIVSTVHTFPKISPYYGCMTYDGRTTPTATRLEGLINAYAYIPEENISLRAAMLDLINNGIQFLMNAQIKEGIYAGGIPMAYVAEQNIPRSIDLTNQRNAEIRIDYVQHAISAMMDYDKVFN